MSACRRSGQNPPLFSRTSRFQKPIRDGRAADEICADAPQVHGARSSGLPFAFASSHDAPACDSRLHNTEVGMNFDATGRSVIKPIGADPASLLTCLALRTG